MKKSIITIVSSFVCVFLWSQDSIPLPNQALEVVKQFQPKIENAKPIYISPKKRIEESYPALQLNYNTPSQIFTIAYPDPVIKPLVFEEDDHKKDLKDGYLKLAYGNFQSPLIESQLHYDIQDWFQTGISLRHNSAKDDHPEVFRSFSNSLGEIYASYFMTDQTKVSLDIRYENDNRNLCCTGIKEFDLLPTVQLDDYGLALRVDHNSFSVKGFSTKHNISVNRINSRTNVQSEYKFSYSSNSNKTIGKSLLLNLPIKVDYFTSDLWVEDPLQIQGRPNLFYKKDKYSIRVGAFLASNDTLFVRPDLEISYLLPWHNLEAVASYKANSSVNSLHKFYREMPYFKQFGDEQTSFAEEEVGRLGVRYKTEQANIYLGGMYGNFTDQSLYTYEDLGHHYYELAQYNGFGAELKGSYDFKKILSIHTELTYRDYVYEGINNNDVLLNPFYIPQLEAFVRLEQSFFKSLKFYETLRYVSRRSIKYKEENINFVDSIDPFTDLGVGMEYLYKNTLGIFAEANNLLNTSYNQFYLDKSFKLNYHLGIKFLF